MMLTFLSRQLLDRNIFDVSCECHASKKFYYSLNLPQSVSVCQQILVISCSGIGTLNTATVFKKWPNIQNNLTENEKPTDAGFCDYDIAVTLLVIYVYV